MNSSENWGNTYFLLKLVSALCHFWTGLSLVILISLGFRQNTKFFKGQCWFCKICKVVPKSSKNAKWQDIQGLKNQELQISQN